MTKIILFFLPAVIPIIILDYFNVKSSKLFIFLKRYLLFTFVINTLVWGTMFFSKKNLSLELNNLYTIGFCLKYALFSLFYGCFLAIFMYIFLKKARLMLVFKKEKK